MDLHFGEVSLPAHVVVFYVDGEVLGSSSVRAGKKCVEHLAEGKGQTSDEIHEGLEAGER